MVIGKQNGLVQRNELQPEFPIQITILILEKLSKPSSVKSGVPSSMNDKSVRYMPR